MIGWKLRLRKSFHLFQGHFDVWTHSLIFRLPLQQKKLFHLRKNTFFICCFTFCILPSSNLNKNNSEKCINYIYIFNTMIMHCWVNVLIILINCPSFCLQCKLLSTKKKKKFEFVESHFLSMSMEKNKNRNLFYTRLFGELFIIQIWKIVNDLDLESCWWFWFGKLFKIFGFGKLLKIIIIFLILVDNLQHICDLFDNLKYVSTKIKFVNIRIVLISN
jgi:hypothetical protein